MLTDVERRHMTVVDVARAKQAFPPASTFKIANSLIALETGAVRDVDEVIPYGGKPQPFPQWERDMSMREAIAVSNVPVYQEVARRVGLERMDEWVRELGYGNGEIGEVVDRFWLDGPLEINAFEQARFVAMLARGELRVSERSRAMVREILKLEERDGALLYGKTGWATSEEPDVGWWVGWVERGGKVYAFALNMDMATEAEAPKRQQIAKALLAELGVWPAD